MRLRLAYLIERSISVIEVIVDKSTIIINQPKICFVIPLWPRFVDSINFIAVQKKSILSEGNGLIAVYSFRNSNYTVGLLAILNLQVDH